MAKYTIGFLIRTEQKGKNKGTPFFAGFTDYS